MTLAPVGDPVDLLATLGVESPERLDDVAEALREHAERALVMESWPPQGRMPPMLAASGPAGGWSVAVQVSGILGWEGCTPSRLGEMAERYGFVCSAYFDADDAKLYLAERGGLLGELDVVKGLRRGTVGGAAGERLTRAGFDLAGVPGMASELRELLSYERLGVALAAVTGYSLDDCVACEEWLGGLGQR
ncbi:hypothetical protein ACWGI0_33060 [Streptomyces sp. NPDC054802]